MAATISSPTLLSPISTFQNNSFSLFPTFKSKFCNTHRVISSLKMVSDGYVDKGSIFRSNYSSSSYYSDVNNGRIMVGSCLVVPPPKHKRPRGIVEFLGGAFIGAVSHVTYSYLVNLLAKEGYLIVLVPYNVTFNHEDATRQVYERFNTCLDILLTSGLPDANLPPSWLTGLPVFSAGHSNGALLQVLTASYFSDKIPKANAIISFNNRPATEAVPYFEQLGPLVSQVMPFVEESPLFSMATSASGDAWKVLLDTAGTMLPNNDPEAITSLTQFVDQLPKVFSEDIFGVGKKMKFKGK